MPALVAPGICRYAVKGTYAGRPVVNILDMKIDTTGSTDPRSEACFNQAGLILNAWSSQILAWLLVNNYVAREVAWIDLDELDGTTGTRSSTEGYSWPMTGAGAGDAMPGNVCIRVNKRTNSARGRKQGRMYLAGVNEGQTSDADPNSLAAENVAGGNAKLANFLTDITKEDVDQGLPGYVGYTSQLHVVHTVAGVYDSSSEVNSLEIDGRLGSQRRRLR